jgi:hypothetical protein
VITNRDPNIYKKTPYLDVIFFKIAPITAPVFLGALPRGSWFPFPSGDGRLVVARSPSGSATPSRSVHVRMKPRRHPFQQARTSRCRLRGDVRGLGWCGDARRRTAEQGMAGARSKSRNPFIKPSFSQTNPGSAPRVAWPSFCSAEIALESYCHLV